MIRCHRSFQSSIAMMVLIAFVFSTCFPLSTRAAGPDCVYDEKSPTLDHAVKAFMDPAIFECAEEEIRAVLQTTLPSDRATIARGYFLLAGALFGRTLTGDISQSLISEQLVLGFLDEPNWTGPWYFEDMPDFMSLIPAARSSADSLMKCSFNRERPSPSHAREMMERYGLYTCAADEAMAAIDFQMAADSIDSLTVAEAHFVLGQAYYGMRLTGLSPVDDSVIVEQLTTGFIITWEHLGNWVFNENEDFVSLTQEARRRAGIERGDGGSGFFRKSTLIVAGVGAAVAGILVALLTSGDDKPEPTVDTIPSFPPPPGQ